MQKPSCIDIQIKSVQRGNAGTSTTTTKKQAKSERIYNLQYVTYYFYFSEASI